MENFSFLAVLSLIHGITTLLNTLSTLLAEKEEYSFLNIELLNSNVSGELEGRWRKPFPQR